MSTNPTTRNKRHASRLWMALAGVVVLACAAVGWMLFNGSRAAAGEQTPYFTVTDAPLTISVTVSGSIRNSEATVLRNEVEGATTILYIIDEGSFVKQGDLLVEIDASKLTNQKVDQEIKVRNDEAAHINARENLEITRKKGVSDVKSAEVALELAILDLEKYTGIPAQELLRLPSSDGSKRLPPADLAKCLSETNLAELDLSRVGKEDKGEYSQQLKEAINRITIVSEELKRAQTTRDGSRLLKEKGYISQTELDADELDLKRKQLDLEVAQSELELLEKYTKPRKIAELISGVDQKAFALTKAHHESDSNLRDAQAKLDARLLEFNREQEQYEKLIDQVGKCKLTAPHDGMVVYGEKRSRWEEPLKQGMQVYERQELVRLPKPGGMIAEVKVPESSVEKIKPGLPVQLTFDALTNKKYRGAVQRVSMVPDEEDGWLNPDAKTYQVVVTIEDNGELQLKPGMSCTAEIIVHHYNRTLFVPVQSVFQVEGKPTVYVMDGAGQPQPRPVETGLDNNRMIAIASGLKAGDRVQLSPELKSAERPQNTDLPDDMAQTANAVSAQAVKTPNAASEPESPQNPGSPDQPQPGAMQPTPEQRAQMMERLLAMIPEEHREKVKNMSQEERTKWFQSEEGQKIMAAIRDQSGGQRGRRGERDEGQGTGANPGGAGGGAADPSSTAAPGGGS